ncbi:Naringenin,2-oxoglutarate 3-dioxygenase [Triticum urartu]|uniref:Naringenin,2-oxoglutarate 3-dioxygenase n=1 Tax=Triticum urartu TaxID=4572 RepID=M7YEP3_TRIUA|nr:Naringenin,2-oxoglutarate 3-dioxygenase [Triticum urartu]
MCDELERKRGRTERRGERGKNRASSGGRRVYVRPPLAPVRARTGTKGARGPQTDNILPQLLLVPPSRGVSSAHASTVTSIYSLGATAEAGGARPRRDEVVPDADIPVVDLANPDRAAVVAQIGAACSSHGFFQVLNHGLPVEVMLAAMAVAHDFFRLSPEEKAKLYSDDPAKKTRLSTSFNVRKETVHNWRDYLRLHCHPEGPANPPPFRYFSPIPAISLSSSLPENRMDVISTYCKEVQELGFRFYAALSESLGLEQDYIKMVLGEQEQHMAVNFYPKCPSPELTYGLPAHTVPNALTILMMDEQVAGLQVLKEGRWIAVNPQPNAFIINLGDQLQVRAAGVTAGGGE